jgi:hypothetical protein
MAFRGSHRPKAWWWPKARRHIEAAIACSFLGCVWPEQMLPLTPAIKSLYTFYYPCPLEYED